jgi:hypothetical protein
MSQQKSVNLLHYTVPIISILLSVIHFLHFYCSLTLSSFLVRYPCKLNSYTEALVNCEPSSKFLLVL